MADKQRILIIDDDVDLLTTLGDFLDLEGFAVDSAVNGEEGLEKVVEFSPELIILDISMPGMGGVAFLTALSAQEHDVSIPVCVFTARANMEEFFDDVEVAGFLAKPCDPNELLSKIKTILASVPASAPQPTTTEKKGGGALISRKIILAESEEGAKDVLVRALSDAGYTVVTVSTGSELVEKAIVDKPDIIVSRLVLSNLNGDAAANMLREMPTTKAIPFLVYDDSGASPRSEYTSVSSHHFVASATSEDVLNALKEITVSGA